MTYTFLDRALPAGLAHTVTVGAYQIALASIRVFSETDWAFRRFDKLARGDRGLPAVEG